MLMVASFAPGLCQNLNKDGLSRFHDIAWVKPKDDYQQGIIAGALENGSLDLWDADKLLTGEE